MSTAGASQSTASRSSTTRAGSESSRIHARSGSCRCGFTKTGTIPVRSAPCARASSRGSFGVPIATRSPGPSPCPASHPAADRVSRRSEERSSSNKFPTLALVVLNVGEVDVRAVAERSDTVTVVPRRESAIPHHDEQSLWVPLTDAVVHLVRRIPSTVTSEVAELVPVVVTILNVSCEVQHADIERIQHLFATADQMHVRHRQRTDLHQVWLVGHDVGGDLAVEAESEVLLTPRDKPSVVDRDVGLSALH